MGETVITVNYSQTGQEAAPIIHRIVDFTRFGPIIIADLSSGGYGTNSALVEPRTSDHSVAVRGHTIYVNGSRIITGPDVPGIQEIGSQATARWEPLESVFSDLARPSSRSIS